MKKEGVILQASYFSSWSRRMNCEWMPTVPRGFVGIAVRGEAVGLEERVDRGVAVAVDEERGSAVVHLLHPLVERRLRKREFARASSSAPPGRR